MSIVSNVCRIVFRKLKLLLKKKYKPGIKELTRYIFSAEIKVNKNSNKVL